MTHKKTSANPYDSFALEEIALRGATTRSVPTTFLRRGSAGNDAALEEPALSREELDAWAQASFGANGFGDVSTADTTSLEWPTHAEHQSYELYLAARAYRSYALGQIIAAVFGAIGAALRQAYRRYQKRREAAATYDALQQLDDRALNDLGFDRSELGSVAAELADGAERTRLQVPRQAQRSPRVVERELA